VERGHVRLTPLDRLYLERAYELAARGLGDTAPNPPAGAVVVARDGRVVGEGYHHFAGEPHAEPIALARAGALAQGATIYVSLEPCDHVGRTPPCTEALLHSGVARVVAGAGDPTGHGNVARLREQGIEVEIAGDARGRELIEIFARSIASDRPYVALKMAMSLDGAVASAPGVQEWITSEEVRRYVRELRIVHDAVMVGAGTVRIDDPQLTVRPPHARRRPYLRIVACESGTLPRDRRIFAPEDGYQRTIVLAPSGARDRFAGLNDVADVLFVGAPGAQRLDLVQAMKALRARDVASVLCEGGPRLAAGLVASRQVDRVYWAIAPVLLGNERAVPVLAGGDLAALGVHVVFDRVLSLGPDVMLSGTFIDV
jgi:diaminohydroxyphosphoribosylaminopyrimidine deaminase / 5-amino-6-(5-phosphoribosylamino)uracil reductase